MHDVHVKLNPRFPGQETAFNRKKTLSPANWLKFEAETSKVLRWTTAVCGAESRSEVPGKF